MDELNRKKKLYISLFLCGVVMFISEIWKQYCLTFLVNHGAYIWWNFPFQLCSIPMYLCLLIPFVTERLKRVFLTFLMTFGLMGGVFTFFDTSGLHYSYAPLTIHSYAWHVLLIVIGVYAGIHSIRYSDDLDRSNVRGEKKEQRDLKAKTGDGQPSGKDFLGATLCYLVCCILATFINVAFHEKGEIDMFYISPYHRMEQKVFKDIALATSNEMGILVYILASIVGAFLFFLLFRKLRDILSAY